MVRLFQLMFVVWLLSLSTPAIASSKSFRESLVEGYIEQAKQFSDETLVDQANSPDWAWAYLTPSHVLNELLRRGSESPERAIEFTKLMLKSFEYREEVRGTHIQSVFNQIFAQTFVPLMKSELAEVNEISELLLSVSSKIRAREDFVFIGTARREFFKKVIVPGATQAAEGGFARALKYYQFINGSRLSGIYSSDSLKLRIMLVEKLIESASSPEDGQKLADIYLSRPPGQVVTSLLSKIYNLRPVQTIELLRSKIEGFDESSRDLIGISEEISFLRKNAPKDVWAAIVPKLRHLLEIADKRGDRSGKLLLLESMGGNL